MPETTPLIKAALNLRGGAGFDVYGLSIHECHKESLSNKIGITRLCNPLAYPASYNNHGDFLLSEVKQSIKISHCSI